jgi:4-amino-4-deoxy-L-arabinose transferase-like glycosyltransferase
VSAAAAFPATDHRAARAVASGFVRVVALAFVLRAAVFPFADNKHGDAPMRALIAQRVALAPAAALNPRTFCQFGPLHPALMAPVVALAGSLPWSSRALSLAAGMLTFVPFFRLSRRLVGRERAELAALGLAASPLHIQASTTAASEALYLLLFVAMLERLTHAIEDGAPLGRFAAAGVLASLAAVTRYDAWLALPATLAAAWVFARGPVGGGARARRALGLGIFAALAAALPAAWIAWGALRSDDPLFFFHYITSDHAQLAATALARYGPALGRARQIGVWSISFVAAMTPALAVAAVAAPFRAVAAFRAPAALRVVLVAGLAPIAFYLAKGLVRLEFEPLPRFALVPGALLLPLAATAVPLPRLPAARAAAALSGLAFAVAAFAVAASAGPRVWAGAESVGALTRLDAEDRALAEHLRARRAPGERVMIEPLAFAEIAIAAAGGVPQTDMVTLAQTREPAGTVGQTARATGATWFAAYDDDRPEAWTRRLPDWPADARGVVKLEQPPERSSSFASFATFGRWRVIHW